ncbi:MAG TPA: threonine--tRNA ligase, partial [Bordetella sp.]|nr:threonine--tRNA ligase [Bordetella sp.]
FHDVLYKVATRPEKRIGSDETWDAAEQALMDSLRRTGCEFEISPGEGAFYGPKIEYTLKDAIGRHWQCGTLQVDFSMPVRLGAEYVDADDQRRPPVMLHRAILGSLERFIGMLIENHAGAMPPWLAPVQAVVCCISEPSAAYAAEITQTLKKQGFRVQSDLRGEKITYKIREHSLQKIPYILVVGDKEREAGTVAVRARGGLDLGTIPLGDFVERLSEDVAGRRDIAQPQQGS